MIENIIKIKTRGENMKTSQIITENKSAANYLTLKSKLKKHLEIKKREKEEDLR